MPTTEVRHLVQVDLYIARRKRVHSIYNDAGEAVYHSPLMIEVLAWFNANDIHAAYFTDDEDSFLVSFQRAEPETPFLKGTQHGQSNSTAS